MYYFPIKTCEFKINKFFLNFHSCLTFINHQTTDHLFPTLNIHLHPVVKTSWASSLKYKFTQSRKAKTRLSYYKWMLNSLGQHEFIQFTMNGNKNVFCGLNPKWYFIQMLLLVCFPFQQACIHKMKRNKKIYSWEEEVFATGPYEMREIRVAFPCNSSSYQVVYWVEWDCCGEFWYKFWGIWKFTL